jgi:hypothetical protein
MTKRSHGDGAIDTAARIRVVCAITSMITTKRVIDLINSKKLLHRPKGDK